MKFKLKIIHDYICFWGWQFFTIRPLFFMMQTLDHYQEYFIEGNYYLGMIIIPPDTKPNLPKYKLHYTSGTALHPPRFYFDEYPAIGQYYNIKKFLYKKLIDEYEIEKYINSIDELLD